MAAGYSKEAAESIVIKEAARAAAGFPPYGANPEPPPVIEAGQALSTGGQAQEASENKTDTPEPPAAESASASRKPSKKGMQAVLDAIDPLAGI